MKKVGFLFPGQGSQQVGMGKDFYENFSLAQEIFSRADEALGYKISKICFEGPEEDLKLTQNTQPALLVVSYIAYLLLDEKPWIAAGHSLGEYSSLVAAGSLTFEDGIVLVHKRGKYMQEAVPVGEGAMAALLGVEYKTIENELSKVKSGIVEIANWNSREQIVIAGQKQAVEEAISLISPPRSVILPVSAPFHCRLMKSAEEKLSLDLDKIEFKDLSFPIVTNVDARIITKGEEARDALKRQVSRPVLWYKTMEILNDERVEIYVELGPGKVLSGLLKKTARNWDSSPAVLNVEDVSSLREAKEKLSGAF